MRIRVPNYNIIAPFYDWLARIFIPFNVWTEAHQEILAHIPTEGVVWIMGTGSGSFLREYKGKAHFISIDPSDKMTHLARKNLWDLDVKYVLRRHDDIPMGELTAPDVIICPFFMQLLKPHDFIAWHNNLASHYPSKTFKWLYVDFERPAISLHWLWQVPYLISMFLFMWVMTGKAIFRLKDWNKIFRSLQYKEMVSKTWASNMIWFRYLENSNG